MSYKTFEFTAFSESDLVSGNLRCGSTFTMPKGASTCFSVRDNDRTLSGDNWRNENANDRTGQTAQITSNGQEVGNGGQIYAECYFWVKDQNNKWYVMIEIEQEGSNNDYFTFLNGYGFSTPPEGAELTVVGGRNVCGNWLQYAHLGAGEKAGPETGSITGRFTFDADNNDNEFNDETGTWDEGVEGQTIQLVDLDGKVVATTTTNSYGTYTFKDVPVGDYKVQFPTVEGHEFSAQNSGVAEHFDSDADANGLTDTITVSAGKTTANIDAGIKESVGTISGRVFNDENKDGIDNSEEGQQGVTVQLLDENGNAVLGDNGQPITTTTDANGEYQFEDIAKGNYRVKFETPEDKDVTEQNVGSNDAIDSDINKQGISDVVTVETGKETANVDAGYVDSHICVRMLEGDTSFKVDFDSHTNIVTEDVWFAQKSTDPGSAKIIGDTNITEGNTKSYKLQLDEPVTEDTQVTITIKDGTAKQADSSVREFTVYYGNQSNTSLNNESFFNFGVVHNETVQYYTTSQHHQDKVEARWYNDPIYKSGNTGNADDNYVGVQNLVNDYKIIDSNGNEVSGTTFTVTIPAGSTMSESFQVVANKEVNVGKHTFGLFGTESTENFSLEVTQIGERTDVEGETTINITDVRANVSPIAFDLNANGEIDVTGDSTARDHTFKAGARTVEFDLDNDGKAETIEWLKGDGDGFLVDTSKIGSNNDIDGGALFGDEGGKYTDGYEKLALHDSNNDGVLTGGELSNLAIWVDDGDAILEDGELRQLSEFGITELSTTGKNVDVNGEQLLRSETRVNAESVDKVTYSITGADAEFFQIDPNTGEVTYADGFVPDFENPLDEGADNVYNIQVVRTGSNLEEPEIEHLCVEIEDSNALGSISGRVFLDDNCNGVDDSEGGQQGVTVSLLDRNGTAILDENGQPITTTTNANGEYTFNNIEAGDYRVKFEAPDNKVFTEQNIGKFEAIDSDVNAQGLSDIVTLPEGRHVTDVDAGLKPEPAGSISGRAFFDENYDGIDNSEEGIQDVKVTLLDKEGNEVLGENGQPITTLTNAQGEYTFNDVPVGEYRVKFDRPTDKEATEQNVGNNDSIDSDINSQGISDVFTVESKKATTDVDAGYIDAHACITMVEGDPNLRVDFDSHKNIVTEDVWFAQKNTDPGSAKIVGDHNITEGNTRSYKLQLDEVVTEDTYVTIRIKDGTAKQADSSVEEFTVYYPQYNGYNFGTVQGETVQYYTTSQHHQNKVESIWYNDPIYKHGQIGNADDNYVGVHNLVNDFKIIGSNGQEVTGTTFTVKVPAGSSMSENFQVVANKEVNVGKHTFNLFATENTENFSLEVTQIGDRTDVEGQKTISINDVRANVSPIAFDLNANGEIDVTGDSTARDHAFKAGARTVEFDLDNDGKAETIEWLKGDGDGFLVDTSKIGSNNEIDGGALFGDEGGKYANGYEKLALHDSNNDGVLTADELDDLAIWVDDGDAILETGELRQLSEFGITNLSTNGQNVNVNGEQLLRSETRVNAESVDMVRYSITGADAQYFQIDEKTGEVTYADGFVPDFENPLDEGANNVYNIKIVRTGDGLEEPEIEHFCVRILDKPEGVVAAKDDDAETCYDMAVTVDVLANDENVAGITAVNGQAITDGGSAINIDGVLVSLVNGKLVFDGSSAHADLLFGETAVDTFTYTVSGTNGGEATADVDVTFKGATDTLAKVEPMLTNSKVGFQVIVDDFNVGNGVGDGAFSAKLSVAGDNLNGFYEEAYCLDIFASVQPGGYGTDIDYATYTVATVTVATTDFLTEQQQKFLGTGGINGESAADNLDLINWIINQDFENTDNGDGNNQTYTGAEVQGAIWALTNGEALKAFGEPEGVYVDHRFGTDENAQEIVDRAIANGEGFEAGEGDLVGVYVDPVGSPNFTQPFIIGVDLYEECVC